MNAKLPRLLWKRILPHTIAAIVTVVGLELVRAPDRSVVLDDGTFDPYRATLESLTRAELPLDAIEWSLAGVLAVLVVLAALVLVTGLALVGLRLLTIPLFPVLHLLSLTADAVKRAEQATTHAIHVEEQILPAASSVKQVSQNVLAPRLVVLRVATPVWQQTVKGFAEVCSAPLIDLSDVSENVVREVEELTREFGPRCLFVGRHDRVGWLADPPAASPGSDEGACSGSSTDTRCSHTRPTGAELGGSSARCAPSS